MIVFDLDCLHAGHRFEGWFKSSDDFVRQQQRGFVTCPNCGSSDVVKAVQAPRLTRKGNQMPTAAPTKSPAIEPQPNTPVAAGMAPPQVRELAQKLAQVQADALKSSRWVGESFADDARAMHYGEREAEVIHGRATLAEAKELVEEGIGVLPLPFPVAPPEQTN